MSKAETEIYLGIDPGKSGAISAIWAEGDPIVSSCNLSWTEADIVDWLLELDDYRAFAVIEKVHSSPQMGVTSAFTFGQSYGFLRGILAASKIPFVEVSPQKWQREMGCMTKGDKNVTKQAAQQRWPKLKITHANADSLLIAEYARCFLNK